MVADTAVSTSSLRCFPPVASPRARVLILGSFPGVQSLRQQQYYAHPRNAFWTIMAALLSFDQVLSYHDRLAVLRRNRIALWDVMQSCDRIGSLDSAIAGASIRLNDFAVFFSSHQELQAVFFNGGRAEKEFRRRVLPLVGNRASGLELVRLPSTSPALASLDLQQKIAAWQAITRYL